ncbi:MAG: HAD-IB family hydrolase [Acidimicrobiales bacterium]
MTRERAPRYLNTPGACTGIAAFDFDGTLARGGSVMEFLVATRGTLTVAASLLRLLPLLVLAVLFGGNCADRFKERLFVRVLGGMTESELMVAGEEFARRHFGRKVRGDMLSRLEWHRSKGHLVVIVSASPECYIGTVAKMVGAAGAVATQFRVGNTGQIDGRLQGRNCRGAEKARRLQEWIDAEAGQGRDTYLWAYGNSLGDRDMLSMADCGINVGRLGRWGRLRKFAASWNQQDMAAPDDGAL